MSTQDSGERAFPFFDRTMMNSPEYGMSLRDYFAAKAMAVSLMPVSTPLGTQWPDKDQLPQLAEFAYWVADAMLAERAK